ncbi:hypothetical protein GCM10011386_30460 [Parapedobacter defluvii]|uniref:Lanthionine synthetase C-like protein n=1 Tax=Parapedobacter defluvii TaxID=2045106 RepID=A0ABQ1M8F8_9SPHI|nr:lanthionine synthetase LanC family protein [Parapedobacter defluvii]GGC36226.1 hypothetical protein GCM10011386_30460 [Parapedobacter defluvii]
MNRTGKETYKYCNHLPIKDSDKENARTILSNLSKMLSISPISSNGLFKGDMGLCVFLLEYSKFTNDIRLTNTAFSRLEKNFISIKSPKNDWTFNEFNNIYSMKCGFLGVDIGLTFCHESRYFEVDQDTFSSLDSLINKYLFVDNLLDFSVSTGMVGIGLYLIGKLKSTRISTPEIKSENLELLKKVLRYTELSFGNKISTDFNMTRYISDLYIDKIEHSFIPLLCDAHFVFQDKAEFLEKLRNASYKLLFLQRKKNIGALWSEYDTLLLANSLYIASTYLNDKRLAQWAVHFAESAVQSNFDNYTSNLSFGNGLAGIMYICHKLHRFQNSPFLRKAIIQAYRMILADLEKRIISDKIKDSDHSLCYGLSGTAITILSIISEDPSNWDSLLGLGRPYQYVNKVQ